MTARMHAVPDSTPSRPGQCGWRWHFEDVTLRCEENVLPGAWFCAEHFIQINTEEPTE